MVCGGSNDAIDDPMTATDIAILQWQERIDRVTQEVRRMLHQLPAEKLYQKAETGGWSIAQIIRHVMRLNDSYLPGLQRIREGHNALPWTGRIGWLVRKVGDVLLQSVEPTNTRKSRTFPIWEPPADQIPGEDLLEVFCAHQEILKQRIQDHAAYLGKHCRISSPANKYLVYTLDKAFELMVTHEERHLDQLSRRIDSLY
jgi:hypothetical protein